MEINAYLMPYISLFFIGLFGGGHCIAMCGGIVSLISQNINNNQNNQNKQNKKLTLIIYNFGRIFAYTVAGLLIGFVGEQLLNFQSVIGQIKLFLYLLSAIVMIGMGLYLLGFPFILLPLEKLGKYIWKFIQPAASKLLVNKNNNNEKISRSKQIFTTFLLGFLWGWLPCGLVYSALITALTSTSIIKGSLLMLAFGLGTLPNLLLSGLLLNKLNENYKKIMRYVGGIIILIYGCLNLIRLCNII